ncbi:TetR/AcrR family transcriptional regulator [Humibacter sp. RRB41]|uniref:TetR/AcrR family transcriptional regulator n=1 Tax=Humibacter sp. RRB41 TaxID=2919946 RepID=UPI001FA99C00|nr:TetR family transcriptional regulator [Humibacter sp. RRB41]
MTATQASESSDAAPRRGRPVEVQPEQAALIALRLFDERGYDEVSMEDVARAAGMSRRSLFRYFPRKADLVWSGAAEAQTDIRGALARARPEASTIDALRAAYATALDFSEDQWEATRRRLLLIQRHPSLYDAVRGQLDDQRELLASFIAEREGLARESLLVHVLTDAVSAASFSALVWWASGDERSPAEAVNAALAELQKAFGATSPIN